MLIVNTRTIGTIRIISSTKFIAQFSYYSLTICLLRYYPRHVSSINMPIFRRKNCIHTASGIFALCKRLQSTLVESGRTSALNQCTRSSGDKKIYLLVFRMEVLYSCFLNFPQNLHHLATASTPRNLGLPCIK